MNRRTFLGTSLVSMNISLALALGLLQPTRVLASWPTDMFFASTLGDALNKASNGNSPAPNDGVEIQAREIAEDGSSVPVTIRSRIPDTRSITLLSEKNPNPAVARFTVTPRIEPLVGTRIKMGGSGDLIAGAQRRLELGGGEESLPLLPHHRCRARRRGAHPLDRQPRQGRGHRGCRELGGW